MNSKKNNQSLRISFLSHSSYMGSAEKELLKLIKDFLNKNIICHVILPMEGWLCDEITKLAVSIDIIPLSWWTYENGNKILWDEIIDSSVKVADLLTNNLPDIIFTNTIFIPQGALVASFFKIPHIWHINNYDEQDNNLLFILDNPERSGFFSDYAGNILCGSKKLKLYFDQLIDLNKSIIQSVLIGHDENKLNYSDKIIEIMNQLYLNKSSGNISSDIFKEFVIKYKLLLDKDNANNYYENIYKNKIHDLNQSIDSLKHLIKEKENSISRILGSRSWRITSPLRKLDSAIHFYSPLFITLLQRLFDNIPLPAHRKKEFSNFIFYYLNNFINNNLSMNKVESIKPFETFYEKLTYSIDKIPGLNFPNYKAPIVSIIIPVYNNWRHTYSCLKSIRERSGDSIQYEIIVADDGSTDETPIMLDQIKGIHYLLNKDNLGFLRSCNNAAAQSRGRYILFLNNDTEVQDDWLEPLVNVFERFNKVGMVGSKLLFPNGYLQEAGGIIWNDGSAWNFGRADNPKKPEYNYIKEVDYCSGACILIRKDLWNQLSGFDEQFVPAYCEDSDFALQVRKAGYKVLYQPKSRVVHFEGVSCGTEITCGVKQYQVINQEKLFKKWQATIKTQSTCPEELFLARDRSQSKKIILFIDDKVPEHDKHAGGLTTYQYISLFCDMNFKVIFLPDNLYPLAPYTSELQQLGVEVLYGSINIGEWLGKTVNICIMFGWPGHIFQSTISTFLKTFLISNYYTIPTTYII